MTRIQADPQVQQQLQARGITQEVGVFGNHRVQVGNGAPIRLDSIRSAPVPFAGFRSATKIARGEAGVRNAGGEVLRALTRPGGKLDANAILGNLMAARTQISRLANLGRLAGPAGESTLRAFAPLVENMSNEELSAAYQCFMSAEMDLIQTALGHEGRAGSANARAAASDLFDVQALILKEVSDRVTRGEGMPGADELRPLSRQFGPLSSAPADAQAVPPAAGEAQHEEHITHANLRTLVERGAQSATTRENMLEPFQSDMQARGLPPELSARAMGDIMRSAELTRNMSLGAIFTADLENSPLAPENDARHMDTAFHLAERGQRGDDDNTFYMKARNAVESSMFPELYTQGANPAPADAHPAYAALNLDLNPMGIRAYGECVLVLRPEVAQRATYTADDSFYNMPISTDPQTRRPMLLALLAHEEQTARAENKPPMLPESFYAEMADPSSARRQIFEKWCDSMNRPEARSELLSITMPIELTDGLNYDQKSYLDGMLLEVFIANEEIPRRMATHDSLETLLPGMATPTLGSLARAAAQDGARGPVGLLGSRYIEAQIQGGIILSRDVAEIRIPASACRSLPAGWEEMADNFSSRTGIPITRIADDVRSEDAVMQRIADSNEASRDFARAHFNRDSISRLADEIAEHPHQALADILSDNPFKTMPQAVRESLLELNGAALNKAMNKFHALVTQWTEQPAIRPPGLGIDDESSLVTGAFQQIFSPLLEIKATLLTDMLDENTGLRFDTQAQKANFTRWVMGSGALSLPEEMRMIHSASMDCAAALRELADKDPAPEAHAVLQSLIEVLQKHRPAIEQFLTAREQQGKEAGPDDRFAQISRMAFMGLSMLEHGEGGAESGTALANLLSRPEQRTLFGQATSLLNLIISDAVEKDNSGALSDLNVFTSELQNTLAARTNTDISSIPFRGEYSLIPSATRDVLRPLAEGFINNLNRSHPAYQPFPAPAMPERLPQNDAQRRSFLVNAMLGSDGPYANFERTHEPDSATHGRGHIARTFIFASAFCNILDNQGVHADHNAVLMGISGHDMGRQGSGDDYWEKQSAELLTGSIAAAYGEEAAGETYNDAVQACIADPTSPTLERRLLNAADSLDVGRTKEFELDHRFCFLIAPGAPASPQSEAQRLREQLAREADLLQRISDPLCMYRPAVDELTHAALAAAPREVEAIQGKMTALRSVISAGYAGLRELSGEEFMTYIENMIRANPKLFPVLHKHYIEPMKAAATVAQAA